MNAPESVSIIVPAYNEAKRVAQTLRGLRRALPGAEIIVVDDGSRDATAAVSHAFARVVRHERNRGKGEAMRTGARAARGQILLFVDASQFYAEDAPRVLRALRNADFAVGVRDGSVIPWHRRVTNALTRVAVFLGTGRLVSDPLSGFRAVRKKDFLRLATGEARYCIEADMMFRALLHGFKLAEVPVRVAYAGLPRMRLGSASARPSLFFRQRFLDEALFNIRTVLKIWLGLFR